jgi:hypothetical protein
MQAAPARLSDDTPPSDHISKSSVGLSDIAGESFFNRLV